MSASTLLDDLISWWTLNDDPDDGIGTDEQHRTQMTATNLTRVTGRVGNAVEFNSAGTSRLYAASNGLLQLEKRPFTFALWVKFNAFTGSHVLVSKTNSDPITAQYRIEYDSFTTSIAFRVGRTGGNRVVLAFNGAGPPVDVWQFVVCWLDSATGYLHIRMNDSDYENVSTSPIGASFMTVNSVGFYVGSNPDGTDPLDGAMDNLAVWGRVLTRAEQSALWNDGMGVNYCSLPDGDCKSATCCDLKSFDYVASAASDADGTTP